MWGDGEGIGGIRVTGGDFLVVEGGNQSGGGKGSSGDVRRGGRGQGVVLTKGAKIETPGMEHKKIIQVANLTN